MSMNPMFKLCKKVTDPPDSGVWKSWKAWKSVPCCICGVALRATVRATNAAAKLGVELNPLCFDCAKHGPEYVLNKFGSNGKVK